MVGLNVIIALNTVYIAISNAANYQFTTNSPLSTQLVQSQLQCAPNEPCFIECLGVGSCDSQGSNILGPGPSHELTIKVDSQSSNTIAITFRADILCAMTARCSKLNIFVEGDGLNAFKALNIYTPISGLTTLDCTSISGNAVTNGFACPGNTVFYGEKGFGQQSGQVYIKDTSTSQGRVKPSGMRYHCTSNNGWVWHDQCIASQWNTNQGFLQCAPLTLPCQVTPSPTVAVVAPQAPQPKTLVALRTGTVGLRTGETTSLRGNTNGFVTVSEFDYYIMRVCEVIVAIGIFVVAIKAVVVMMGNYNKQIHSYDKVKYNTDVTDEEN